MAKDEYGNDLSAVLVPVTGQIGYCRLKDFTLPDIAEVGKAEFKFAKGKMKPLGLLTDDGGPEWEEKQDGDPIQFWQDGYSLPTGKADVTCKITLAESNAESQEFIRGRAYDTNHHMLVNAGSFGEPFAFYTEEIAANGTIRRRLGERASVTEMKPVKSERGKVQGYEVTITLGAVNGGNFHEWLIPKEDQTGGGSTPVRTPGETSESH